MPGEFERSARGLTDHERQLLDLVREGKVDAEIAVRLGISNAEVKERTARLASKLGVRDKAGLRDLAPRQAELSGGHTTLTDIERLRGGLLRWKLTSAALAVVVVALGVGWLLGRSDGESQPGATSPDTTELSTAEPAGTVTSVPTPTVVSTTIDGRPMDLLGRPFANVGVLADGRIEARETLLVVTLGRPAVLSLTGFSQEASFAGGGGPQTVYVGVQSGVRTIFLILDARPGSEFIYGDDDSVAVFAPDGGSPTFTVSALSQTSTPTITWNLTTRGNFGSRQIWCRGTCQSHSTREND